MNEDGPRRGWVQHVWVALALAACNLALFLIVDYGNTLGSDDWNHVYMASIILSPRFLSFSRPLEEVTLAVLLPMVHTNLIALHFALLATRSLSAFLLYLLVRQLAPDRPLFAVAAGVLLSVFIVPDSSFIFTFLENADNSSAQALSLATLNLVAAYLLDERPVRSRRIGWLVGAAGLAGVTLLTREPTAPLLIGAPILIVLLGRRWTRATLAGLAVYLAVALAVASLYALPVLGVVPTTYASSNFQDLNPARIASASLFQFRFAFQKLLLLDFADVYTYRLPAVLAAAACVVAFWLVSRRIERPSPAAHPALIEFGAWLAGGLIAFWLGCLAFLASTLATSTVRTQFISAPGQAVALAAGVWLISHLAVGGRRRRALQLGGLAFVAVAGAATAGGLQNDLYRLGANWENGAFAARSLTDVAPEVTAPTLFVYIENPKLDETPYVNGFTFQYGVRYFYDNEATGLVPTDQIIGEWAVADDGITMREGWSEPPHTYGWDEMIFVSRDDEARFYILDRLPDDFYSEARQAVYHPATRIRPAFVSEAVQRTYPVVAGPDWTGRRQYLQAEP